MFWHNRDEKFSRMIDQHQKLNTKMLHFLQRQGVPGYVYKEMEMHLYASEQEMNKVWAALVAAHMTKGGE